MTVAARTRAHRSGRVGASVLVALLGLLTGPAPLAPDSARAATTEPEQSEEPEPVEPEDVLRIELTSITPRIGAPGRVLEVTGRLTNEGDVALTDPTVRLRLSRDPLATRGHVERISQGEDGPTGDVVATTTVRPEPTIPAGTTRRFTLRYSLDEAALPTFGVYPLTIEAGPAAATAQQTTEVATFLPWVPRERGFAAMPMVWLWPASEVPRRDASEVFSDRGMHAALSRQGRLARLAQVAAGHAVTWVVDPMVLEDADELTRPHRVLRDGEPTASPPVPGARRWLERLRRAAGGGRAEVLAMPYAVVDAASLRGAALAGDVERSVRTGLSVSSKLLAAPRTERLLVRPPGGVEASAGSLRDGLLLLLSEGAVPPTEILPFTPDARVVAVARGDSSTPVLVHDERLSRLADAPTHSPGARTLAEQRFLAETAMIVAERPSDARAVVVAPPAQWDPQRAYAAALLRMTARAPWMRQATVSDLGPPGGREWTEAAEAVDRKPLPVRSPTGVPHLPPNHLAGVRRLRSDLQALRGVLAEPATLVQRHTRARLRLE